MEAANGRASRAGEIAREVAIGGLAGLVGGLLVVGVGGRLFMRVAAVIDPSAAGIVTSNGNRIGDITVGGTLGFVLFVGLLFGAFGGIIWTVVAPWIPGTGALRALATGVVAVALASFFVIRADERDFRIVGPVAVILIMLIGLVAVVGMVIAFTDDLLRRRLPSTGSTKRRWMVAYVALCGVGLLFLPIPLAAYLADGLTSFGPPVEVGVALLVVGAATLAWWRLRVLDGRREPPRVLTAAGRGALAVAVVLGAGRLWGEIASIL